MLRHGNQSLNVTFKKYELIWGYKATETQYLASVQYIFLEAYSIERQGMGKKKNTTGSSEFWVNNNIPTISNLIIYAIHSVSL